MRVNLSQLISEADELLAKGVYEPEVMFELLYRGRKVHYSVVRKAIHISKTR